MADWSFFSARAHTDRYDHSPAGGAARRQRFHRTDVRFGFPIRRHSPSCSWRSTAPRPAAIMSLVRRAARHLQDYNVGISIDDVMAEILLGRRRRFSDRRVAGRRELHRRHSGRSGQAHGLRDGAQDRQKAGRPDRGEGPRADGGLPRWSASLGSRSARGFCSPSPWKRPASRGACCAIWPRSRIEGRSRDFKAFAAYGRTRQTASDPVETRRQNQRRAMPLLIKICGLKTPEALDAALDAGADMVGFVFFPPSPRNIGLEAAQDSGRAGEGPGEEGCAVGRRRPTRS